MSNKRGAPLIRFCESKVLQPIPKQRLPEGPLAGFCRLFRTERRVGLSSKYVESYGNKAELLHSTSVTGIWLPRVICKHPTFLVQLYVDLVAFVTNEYLVVLFVQLPCTFEIRVKRSAKSKRKVDCHLIVESTEKIFGEANVHATAWYMLRDMMVAHHFPSP